MMHVIASDGGVRFGSFTDEISAHGSRSAFHQPSRETGQVSDVRKPKRGPLLRLGKRLRPPFNRFIARSSLIPTTPYIDPELFAWSAALEAGWHEIRAELDALREQGGTVLPLARISPDHKRVAADGKWKSFVFEAYGYCVPGNRLL